MWVSHKIPEPLVKKKKKIVGVKCPAALLYYGKRTPETEEGQVSYGESSMPFQTTRKEELGGKGVGKRSGCGARRFGVRRAGPSCAQAWPELTISQHLFNLLLTFKKNSVAKKKKIKNLIKFTILTIFKHAALWSQTRSQRHITLATIHLQHVFISAN